MDTEQHLDKIAEEARSDIRMKAADGNELAQAIDMLMDPMMDLLDKFCKDASEKGMGVEVVSRAIISVAYSHIFAMAAKADPVVKLGFILMLEKRSREIFNTTANNLLATDENGVPKS